MTEDEFLAKIKEMLPDMNELILKKAHDAFYSGAFDPDDYDNNFFLPKIFMSAMGEEIKFQYMPINKKEIRERDNLILFL